MYLNRITIIGRLVSNPDFTKGSDESRDRVWGRIAVNRPGSDTADFVPFVAWGGTARAVAEHCSKGKVLILDGQLRTRSTERTDGSYDNYFEVNCSAVYFGPDAKNVKPDAPKTAAPKAQAAPSLAGVDPSAALAMLMQLAQAQSQQQTAPAADACNYDIPL